MSTPNSPSKDSKANPSKQDEPPEEWQIQLSTLKSQADDAFRKKDYSTAIQHYTSCITLDPTNHILYSNRSAAYLSNKEKSRSLTDARKCVELSPGFVKGYSRLAAAMMSLGRFSEALGVYRDLQKRDGGEEMARKGIEECRKLEREDGERKRKEELELAKRREEIKKRLDEEEELEKELKQQTEEKDRKGDDDPLLDDFFNDVEEAVAASNKPTEVDKPKDSQQKKKITLVDLGTATSQISRLTGSNHEWKNLNPFNTFQIPHNADPETISKRYKALSLLVHPDKNLDNIEKAQLAFDYVRKAMDQLEDDEKRRHVKQLVQNGLKTGKREFEKTGGVLEEIQEKCVMKLFADIEMARRDVERRKRNHDQRERTQEDEEVQKVKDEMTFEKKWRETNRVEKRIGNWRDFQKGKKKK